jgi:precorrin-6A/cobalt-precorrin-6A reductase
MQHRRFLILAGTSEARALAERLVEAGQNVVSSFAGVTRAPLLPQGEIHIGGFGGIEGLAEFLKRDHSTHVIDATHPFAAQMSTHAVAACKCLGLPLLRLERRPWAVLQGEDRLDVASMREAAAACPDGARVMLTTGHKGLEPFLVRDGLSGIIRTIEPVDFALPERWRLLLDRPPYHVPGETALMSDHRITHLVTKNAGAAATEAKLHAAVKRGVQVVMIARPIKPPCPSAETLDEAFEWALHS